MNKIVTRVFLALSLGLAATAFAEADKKGCADHPLFPTRMPDFYIVDCKTVEFDAFAFKMPNPRTQNRQEGKFIFITYQLVRGKQDASGVAVASELEGAYGINAARLKGYGVGQLAPVAGNDDEAGRARNRRVDLVKAP